MVATSLERAGILKLLKKVKNMKISGKLFLHSKLKYPKLQIQGKQETEFLSKFQVYPHLIVTKALQISVTKMQGSFIQILFKRNFLEKPRVCSQVKTFYSL